MIGGKWGDAIVGVDIHWVLVPAPPAPAPIPTPLPHPFTGVIYDPIGLAVGTAISAGLSLAFGSPITGPVLINGSPASNTGTEGTNKMVMPHVPTPPGVGWAPVPAGLKPPIPGKAFDPGVPGPVPSNDAVIVTGSKTVYLNGTNATRLGDLAMSCGEPIRLPSSTVIAVPMGPPVLIGGPPALDFMAAALGGIRTSWVSGRLSSVVNRVFGEGSRAARWINRGVCFLTGHPVDVATGTVLTAFTDLRLPGPIPIRLDRVYSSAFSSRDGPFGRGWSSSLHQELAFTRDAAVLRTEDGREIEFEGAGTGDGFAAYAIEHRNEVERLTLRRTSDRTWTIRAASGLESDFALHPARSLAVLTQHRTIDNAFAVDFHYDPAGILVRVTDTAGRRVDLGCDDRGHVAHLTVRGAGGASLTHRRYSYDDEGQLIAVADSLGSTWRFDYVEGLLVQETDRTGHDFCFAYDGIGEDARCVRTWGAHGAFDRVLQRDEANGVTLVSDSLDRTTLYHTDEQSRVCAIVDPLGGRVELAWDDAFRCIRRVDANGVARSLPSGADDSGLDAALERLDVATLLGRGRDTPRPAAFTAWTGVARLDRPGWGRLGLDRAGVVAAAESARGRVFRYDRDIMGRRVRVHDADGVLEERSYDGEGRLLRVRSPDADALWAASYDAEGRIIDARAGSLHARLNYWCLEHADRLTLSGHEVRYEHDNEGRILRRTDSDGREWTFEYDARGDVAANTCPDERTVHYARDAAGRVTAWQFADGSKRALAWDDDDRLTSIVQPDGKTQTFEYDAHGLLSAARTPDCDVTIERDGCGRITRESQGDAWVEVEYDDNGMRRRIRTSFGHEIIFRRDTVGDIVDIHAAAPAGRTWRGRFERNAAAAREVWSLEGGARIEMIRSRTGRLLSRRVTVGAVIMRNETLAWSRAGELEEVRFGDTQIRATDDGASAVNTLTGPAGEQRRSADAFGDVYCGGQSREYSANGAILRHGDVRYAYDAHGRRVRSESPDGAVHAFEWSGADLLEAVVLPDGRRVEFGYDAFARRVWRRDGACTTRWLWCGDVIVHEWQDGAPDDAELWIHHPDLPLLLGTVGAAVTTVVCDVRGNPVLGVDADGRTSWSREVDLWGRVVAERGRSAAFPQRGPGQMEDASTGLFYNRYRYYDPDTGVFLSPDPVLDVSHRSPYAHVRNVLWSIDPLGLAHEAMAWVVDENGRPVIGDDGRPVVVERPRFDPTRPLEDPHSHRYNGNLGHTGHSEPSILRAAEADPRVMGALETPGNRLRIVSQGSGVDRGTRTAAAHKGPRDACASCRNALQEFADDVGRRLGREGDVIVEYLGEDMKKPRQFACH